MGRKSSKQDRGEGAADKAKSRAREVVGSVTGDEEKKAEGRMDQEKSTLKKKKGKVKDFFT